jgi:uncharacterized protein
LREVRLLEDLDSEEESSMSGSTEAVAPPAERSKVRRHPERGKYDLESVLGVLREGLVCHVGLVQNGSPLVIPMGYGLWEGGIVLHGASNSRLMQALAAGAEVCLTVTLLDGLVLARSTFHHSMNYRSVVLFGRGEEVWEAERKAAALEALVEHLVPGRTRDARAADAKELAATTVVMIPLEEASAKIRTGPPSDAPRDRDLPVWAGVIPLEVRHGAPQPDAATGSTPLPDYLAS